MKEGDTMADDFLEELGIKFTADSSQLKSSAQEGIRAINEAKAAIESTSNSAKSFDLSNVVSQFKEAGSIFSQKDADNTNVLSTMVKNFASDIEPLEEKVKKVASEVSENLLSNKKIEMNVDANTTNAEKKVDKLEEDIKQKKPYLTPEIGTINKAKFHRLLTKDSLSKEFEIPIKPKVDGKRFSADTKAAVSKVMTNISRTIFFPVTMIRAFSALVPATKQILSDWVLTVKEKFSAIKDKFPVITSEISKTKNAFSTVLAPIKKIGGAIKTVLKVASPVFKSVGKGFLNVSKNIYMAISPTRMLVSVFKKVGDQIAHFGKIAGLMALRSVINQITKGLGDAFKSAAKQSDRFNRSMSMIYSSLKYLHSSIASAVIPIINALAPIISTLADKFAKLGDTIARAFAYLTGQKTYTKAVKENLDYAASLDKSSSSAKKSKKANEDLKKSLTVASFDEAHLLSKDKSKDSSSDTSKDAKDPYKFADVPTGISDIAVQFKKAWADADFSDIGSTVARKITDGLSKIPWDKIKTSVNKVGKSFATFINGALKYKSKDGKTLVSETGKTIGETLNTIVAAISGFVKNLDWNQVGASLSEGLNSIVKTFDAKEFAETLSATFVGLIDMLASFLENLDWAQLANTLTTILTNINWSGIVSGLFRGLGVALGGIGLFIGTLIGNAFSGIGTYFDEKIAETGGNVGLGILNGILSAWQNIKDWVQNNIMTPFVNGIKSVFGIHSPATKMKPIGKNIILGLKDGMGNLWNTIKEKFTSFFTNLSKWFKEKKTNFKEKGKDIIHSISSGIGDIWKKIKEKFTDFWDNLKKWFSTRNPFKLKVEYDTEATGRMATVAKALGLEGVPKLTFAANGFMGNLQSAELLAVRENGIPEMVGRYGNKTMVANNDQITQAISSAVYNAIVSANALNAPQQGNQQITFISKLDKRTLEKVIYDQTTQKMRRTKSTVGAY